MNINDVSSNISKNIDWVLDNCDSSSKEINDYTTNYPDMNGKEEYATKAINILSQIALYFSNLKKKFENSTLERTEFEKTTNFIANNILDLSKYITTDETRKFINGMYAKTSKDMINNAVKGISKTITEIEYEKNDIMQQETANTILDIITGQKQAEKNDELMKEEIGIAVLNSSLSLLEVPDNFDFDSYFKDVRSYIDMNRNDINPDKINFLEEKVLETEKLVSKVSVLPHANYATKNPKQHTSDLANAANNLYLNDSILYNNENTLSSIQTAGNESGKAKIYKTNKSILNNKDAAFIDFFLISLLTLTGGVTALLMIFSKL